MLMIGPPEEAVTVKDACTEWTAEVPVPTITIVYVPVTADALALSVRFEELPEVTVGGVKDPVTPAGKLLTLNVMDCGEPLLVVAVTL
jgi:hypothetical protein